MYDRWFLGKPELPFDGRLAPQEMPMRMENGFGRMAGEMPAWSERAERFEMDGPVKRHEMSGVSERYEMPAGKVNDKRDKSLPPLPSEDSRTLNHRESPQTSSR